MNEQELYIARLFRPFDEALFDFLRSQYVAELNDEDYKLVMNWSAFYLENRSRMFEPVHIQVAA